MGELPILLIAPFIEKLQDPPELTYQSGALLAQSLMLSIQLTSQSPRFARRGDPIGRNVRTSHVARREQRFGICAIQIIEHRSKRREGIARRWKRLGKIYVGDQMSTRRNVSRPDSAAFTIATDDLKNHPGVAGFLASDGVAAGSITDGNVDHISYGQPLRGPRGGFRSIGL